MVICITIPLCYKHTHKTTATRARRHSTRRPPGSPIAATPTIAAISAVTTTTAQEMSSLSPQSPSSLLLPPLKCVQLAFARRSSNKSHNEPSDARDVLPTNAARAQVAALPHVVDTISDFLDVAHPHIWTLPRACEKNLLHLAQRLGACLHVGTIDDTGSDGDSRSDATASTRASTSTAGATTGASTSSSTTTTAAVRLDPHFWAWQCSRALVFAIQHDNLDMVAWLHDYCPRVLPFAAMIEAARQGNVRLLQWLDARHPDAPWVPQMMDAAASTGQLETLEWLHAHPKSVGCTNDALSLAVLAGHLETVEWLSVHYSRSLEPSAYDCVHALREGNIDTAEFVFELLDQLHHRSPNVVVHELEVGIVATADNGQLKMLQWLHSRATAAGLLVNIASALEAAARSGHLHIVQWLYTLHDEYGSKCERLIDCAAASGSLELVQWLHEHDPTACTIAAMDDAASGGHLAIVQWLDVNRTEGCTISAMDVAARSGHLDVVQWLHDHRTEGCSWSAMDMAATNGHLDVVEWLHEHRTEGCSTSAMDLAACGGYLDVVEWLHEHRTEGCTTDAMDYAAGGGHLDVVKWLHANRTEGCTAHAMRYALMGGHFDVVLFLHTHRSEGIAHVDRIPSMIEHLEPLQWLHQTYPASMNLSELQSQAGDSLAPLLAYALQDTQPQERE